MVQTLDQGDLLSDGNVTVCSLSVQSLTENSLFADLGYGLAVDVRDRFETVHHARASTDWFDTGIPIVLRSWFKLVSQARSLPNTVDQGGVRCISMRDQGGFVSDRRC